MTSNAKWLKLRREKLDQDAAWIAAQRASLDEIEDASVEAEVALAKVIETRAVADEARAVADKAKQELVGALKLDVTPEAPTVH